MAASGVRAKRFIQPTPGGASSIFARQRGMMVAPASTMANVVEGDPRQRESRFGRATGRDYSKFLGSNEGVIKGAVNSLKNLLVGTFIAAKSLSATLKGVIKQIKGMSGGGGGGGFLKTLGMVGLVGAVVAGVAALFAPQIKKAFEFLKGGADGIFQDLKGKLSDLDSNIEKFYNKISGYLNNTIIPAINLVNIVIGEVKKIAKFIENLPTKIQLNIGNFTYGVTIPFMQDLKNMGHSVYGNIVKAKPITPPDPLQPYKDIVDADGNVIEKGLLGPDGINFLAKYDTLGSLGGAMMSGAGNLAMGGIESGTGFIGDIINNILAALGLTGQANTASNFLGMGNLFGQSRTLGSGSGLITSLNQGGGTSTGVGTPEQQALLDAVSFAEGTSKSYGTIFGGQVVPELEKGELTIDEVHAMMTTGQVKGRNAGYASGSAATGRYQFMPGTLRDVQRSMNLPGDTLFTNEMQDKMFLNRAAWRGVTAEVLKNQGFSRDVIDMMAPEIASFPNLYGPGHKGRAPGEGRSYYSGQNVKPTQSIIDAFNRSLQQKVQPAAPAQPAASQQQSAKPKGTTVSLINLPGMQGQKPVVATRPQSPQSPPNLGGGGNPNLPNLDAAHPDNMNAFELGIFV